MLPESCPKCGAAVHPPPNATRVECRYCNHVMQDEAPPAPPPSAGPPQVIVVHHTDNAPVVYSTASMWTRYWIQMAVVFGIVFLSGGGWFFRRMRSSMSSIDLGGAASFGGWDGQSPFLCGGNDSIDISGVNANFGAGAAMTVSGNCHVTCRDCNLRAPVGVEADGNGQVTFVNGTITGTESSFVAGGNATINVTGNARVSGPYRQTANGRVLGVSQPPAARPNVAPAAVPPPPVPPRLPPRPGLAPHGPPFPPPRHY